MTHSCDSWGDMRDEQPLDDPLLTDFFTELRSWGSGQAPEPSAALATLLAAADHVEHAGPLEPVPTPRRKNMIAAKLAGFGVYAKLALGVGVAAAAVTTASITDVLPAPAQRAVAVAVNAISPLELPDGARVSVAADDDDVDLDVDVTVPLTTVSIPGADGLIDDPADDDGDETATDNHGACVSAVANDRGLTGREHGQAVSAIAQSDCGKEDEATTSTTSTTTTTIAGEEDTAGATANSGPSANSGPGNSGSHGNSGGKGSGESGSGS